MPIHSVPLHGRTLAEYQATAPAGLRSERLWRRVQGAIPFPKQALVPWMKRSMKRRNVPSAQHCGSSFVTGYTLGDSCEAIERSPCGVTTLCKAVACRKEPREKGRESCPARAGAQGDGAGLDPDGAPEGGTVAVPHFRIRSPQQDASGQRVEMQPREVGKLFAQPWNMRWLQRPSKLLCQGRRP